MAGDPYAGERERNRRRGGEGCRNNVEPTKQGDLGFPGPTRESGGGRGGGGGGGFFLQSLTSRESDGGRREIRGGGEREGRERGKGEKVRK